MKKLITVLLLIFSSFAFAQKPVFTTAKVNAVTVYFNAAEISQTANLSLPVGTHEIVIKNIANYLNENTVQIGAPSGLTVLSSQFTNDYISEYDIDESSPAIKKVRDSITIVQKQLNQLNNTRSAEMKTIEMLDKNQQVSGVNSGLNVSELMKMVEYYKAKRTEISNLVDLLNEKERKLNDLLTKLNSKLEINSSKEEKNATGKLVLQVMNQTAGAITLDVSYLTNNARWSPFYDLRADNVTSPINMMYKAQVVQNTGIDWKKVKLTLSSGIPNQNNQAPLINPWFLAYQPVYAAVSQANYDRDESVKIRAKASIAKESSSISNYTTINENQLNISFDITILYDILSNGKIHSVSLKEIKLPATYKYYTAPKLDKESFLLAEISDYSKYNLLKGEANIIFEGMYVGKTIVNPGQTSDTLNLSMGRDKKIVITREKVADKSGTKFLSAKKEQTFTYDITIRNNKKEAIALKLEDQYPLSTDKEIEIELKQKDGAKINSEKGLLSWELNLKPNETKKIRISYTVKYPKDKIIGNL